MSVGRLVDGLLKELEHRGPDDRGWLAQQGFRLRQGREVPTELSGEMFLCHRRLSIIDVSEAGAQPMRSADGRFAIIFNGEIYNYVELRAELEKQGIRFHSHSDTEVLLQAFIQWGAKCLCRLTGMFAFAVLDTQRRTLFLARDPFGIKPLFYATWLGGLAFSSEITPLLAFPGIRKLADAHRIHEYLVTSLSDSGERTFFADIRQLPAGHWMEMGVGDRSFPKPVQYWTPRVAEPVDISFAEAAAHLRGLFLKNIRLHLRSDVPVGAALSGGIDSSAIVAGMRHVQGSALQLHTFTYADRSQSLNEERWADLVNQSTGAQAHIVRLDATALLNDLPHLVRIQGEPFGGSSIYAQHAIFREAKAHGIKVMLDGQGSDEIFAGYRSFFAPRLSSLLRQGRLGEALSFARAARMFPGLTPKELFSHTGALLFPDRLVNWMLRIGGREQVPSWLNGRWFQDRGAIPETVTRYSHPGRQVLKSCLARSLVENSVPALLRYEDRNSMAHSVESRVPFLTTELVEFIYALPEEHIIDRDGTTKAVLRAALRGIVPDKILDRRDKIGFATSELDWLREQRPWVESLFRDPELGKCLPVFNRPRLAEEMTRMFTGEIPFNSRLWRWINFRLWADAFKVQFD